MRISAIKKELDERGVGYRGLFEKTEFVELLVDARAKGITAAPLPAPADADGDAGGAEGAGASKDKEAFDPSYKEVEVRMHVPLNPVRRGLTMMGRRREAVFSLFFFISVIPKRDGCCVCSSSCICCRTCYFFFFFFAVGLRVFLFWLAPWRHDRQP